ncbi:MAG TPA: hypothetical protein VK281_01400 [Xanthobacteraceae bacterium]|nr:hypothetical protein [Xanthobacteraceae bacterium]
MKPALLGGDVRHALAMRHINEVERRGDDEVLQAGLGAESSHEWGSSACALGSKSHTPSAIAA